MSQPGCGVRRNREWPVATPDGDRFRATRCDLAKAPAAASDRKATELGISFLVQERHCIIHPPTSGELFDDAVVRDGLADDWRESYVMRWARL